MTKATFFFHGLFPDHIEANEGLDKQICKVLFDVEFDKKFQSHLLADIWPVNEEEATPTFEVRYDLPFECSEFPRATVRYYQQVQALNQPPLATAGPKALYPIKTYTACNGKSS